LSIEVFLIVGLVIFFGYMMWKKRKKAGVGNKESGGGNLYVRLVSRKGGGKNIPDRIWPEPFNSVQEIKEWWDKREDLWEGVEKVELADLGKKGLWQK